MQSELFERGFAEKSNQTKMGAWVVHAFHSNTLVLVIFLMDLNGMLSWTVKQRPTEDFWTRPEARQILEGCSPTSVSTSAASCVSLSDIQQRLSGLLLMLGVFVSSRTNLEIWPAISSQAAKAPSWAGLAHLACAFSNSFSVNLRGLFASWRRDTMLLRAPFCKPPVPRQDSNDTPECSVTPAGVIPFTPTCLKAGVVQESLHKLVTSRWLPGSCGTECLSWCIGNTSVTLHMLNRGSR